MVLAAISVIGVVVAIVVYATRPDPVPAIAPPVASNATPVDVAIDHIARGRDAELAGKLQLAIVEYEDALAQNGPAELLYRLGELSDRLGRPAEAATYYERYLVARADAPDRSVVLARIRTLREPVATDAGVAATVAARVTKDAGVTAPSRDARVTPPPTAVAPSHPPFRGTGTRCECIGEPTTQLCSAVVPVPECRCVRQQDFQSLCKYPMHTVDNSTDCVDTTREECLGEKYPADCNVWIKTVGGRDNAPCQGYISDSTPVDGVWDCTRCDTIYFAAEGHWRDMNGKACRGFHRKSGALAEGTLRYCR